MGFISSNLKNASRWRRANRWWRPRV